MRRINSEFQTKYLSEEGQKLSNRDYFGYVEIDDYACYVMADSLDDDMEANSARYVVESLIRSFVEHPTMRKRMLNRYLQQAHRALIKERQGMRLKASVVLVVTDYRKIRICHVGNARCYLIRNGRYLQQTIDQSLTQNLINAGKLPLDQAAIHEERNNLYSYLGERGNPKIIVSPKIQLENGDIFAQLTRGVWEHCSDEELMGAVDDAKEPQDILNRVEDLILGKQENVPEIDNYSLAVTLISKVYQSPKKKTTLKQILLTTIPIVLIAGGISLAFYLRHQSIKNKEYQLAGYMESGEEYLRYDNYKKASEEYTQAKKLAVDLKRTGHAAESDLYLKLAEQIILADEAMLGGEHVKAQELYLAARELSVRSGNVGKKYIDLQLDQTRAYIEVYDWITVGEIKTEYGDLEGAVEAFRQAREKAAALYAKDVKEEALKKQTAAEERLTAEKQAVQAAEEVNRKEAQAAEEADKKEAQAERDQQAAAQKAAEDKEKAEKDAELELENQQKANDQKNAIELENKGNELMASEQYEHAMTFYRTAQAIYHRLELYDLANGLELKMEAVQAGIEAKEETAAMERMEAVRSGPG